MTRASRVARRAAWCLLGLVLLTLAGEAVARSFPRVLGLDPLAIRSSREYLLTGLMRYEARAHTVFQRPRDGRDGCNSFGYSDGPWSRARTPGVPRILCLGASTTESGNEQGLAGSYPYLLERTLEARTGRNFEVMNAGISGWTSAEMLCAWFLTLSDFQPDVLVLHEASNDLSPRFRTAFEPDYSHWRRPLEARPAEGLFRALVEHSDLFVQLNLWRVGRTDILAASTYPARATELEPLMSEGKLPHETSLPFRRNIESIATHAAGRGVRVVLMTMPYRPGIQSEPFWRYGIDENNQHLRELAAEHGFVLADAQRAFAAQPELAAHFRDLVHLDVAGNQAKAELLADTLAPWLAELSLEGARPPAAEKR